MIFLTRNPKATAGEREEGWENANTVSEIYSDFTVLRPIEAVVDDDIGPFPESILAERHDWDNPNIYERRLQRFYAMKKSRYFREFVMLCNLLEQRLGRSEPN